MEKSFVKKKRCLDVAYRCVGWKGNLFASKSPRYARNGVRGQARNEGITGQIRWKESHNALWSLL